MPALYYCICNLEKYFTKGWFVTHAKKCHGVVVPDGSSHDIKEKALKT
jgi:hypothetical protein